MVQTLDEVEQNGRTILYAWVDPEVKIYTDNSIYLEYRGRTIDITKVWNRIMHNNPDLSVKVYLLLTAIYIRRKFRGWSVDRLVEEYVELIEPVVKQVIEEVL